ncbi:citrate lyase acyl carrier protein [Sulfurospirillum sp. 1612]|uniref:citrate lyase acyl carrier protein n=1 Tax=Sulfurospirillum sp. 1612 TaxID=3094835 RepID=UPI002F9303DF
MNKIKKRAIAGTLESSDAFVEVVPLEEDTIKIELQSSVEELYGDDIRASIMEVVNRLGVHAISIAVQDKGALDFVIKARVQAAILRASEDAEITWEKL